MKDLKILTRTALRRHIRRDLPKCNDPRRHAINTVRLGRFDPDCRVHS